MGWGWWWRCGTEEEVRQPEEDMSPEKMISRTVVENRSDERLYGEKRLIYIFGP